MSWLLRLLDWCRRERQWAALRRVPGPASTFIQELRVDQLRRVDRG